MERVLRNQICKLAIVAAAMGAISANAQGVNAVVTDGQMQFAHGELTNYIVQVDGVTLCENPIAYGRYIACSGASSKQVWVNTNGVLGTYVVVDEQGRQMCSDPEVRNQFRGPTSYITC